MALIDNAVYVAGRRVATSSTLSLATRRDLTEGDRPHGDRDPGDRERGDRDRGARDPGARSRGGRAPHGRDRAAVDDDDARARPDTDVHDERVRGDLTWIGLLRPDPSELAAVAAEFDLHENAVEDARKGHQRAKLERYGDTLFLVLRPAWYDRSSGEVQFGEVHLFVGDRFLVSVRHAERPDLAALRARCEADPDFLARGSEAVTAAVLDEVVDGYAPVVEVLQEEIDAIEDQLFAGHVDPGVSKRIYQLLSEVLGFQRATTPVPAMVRGLLRGAEKYDVDEEVQHRLRNVLDHALRVTERVDSFRALLENALTLHSTLVTQEQNEAMRRMTSASLAQGEESRQLARAAHRQGEEVKKISSWAAILFAPGLIAGIYGMNFDDMPELHWRFGYPAAIVAMVLLMVVLWAWFRKRNWL